MPRFFEKLREGDLLIITADHGCDPTTSSPDHSREYVPLLVWSQQMAGGVSLGTLPTYSAVAATLAEYFGLEQRYEAESFLSRLF